MIVFIADFFADEVLGGGELNNQELISLLVAAGERVKKIKSQKATSEYIRKINADLFIVANFVGLSPTAKEALKKKKYIIYEHDHKYLKTRNPADYSNFTAPKSELVNVEFYEKAQKIFCQTAFHKSIISRNLELDNIESVAGNLWSEEVLSDLERLAATQKEETYAIMDSPILHKNTRQAIEFCEVKGYKYNLCTSPDYKEFISQLSRNKTLVFLPQTPETLSRIVAESRMMGMGTITNKLVGATQESWFTLKGPQLVEYMRERRAKIPELILEILTE